MAVEIKEIIIRAIVQEGTDTTSFPLGSYSELINSSAEQVLKIIEKKKER